MQDLCPALFYEGISFCSSLQRKIRSTNRMIVSVSISHSSASRIISGVTFFCALVIQVGDYFNELVHL